MVAIRKRGADIRQFLLDNVKHHPADIALLTAQAFGISRQAVCRHLRSLIAQKALVIEGTTRNRRYVLHPLVEWSKAYALPELSEEHIPWQNDIRPLLGSLPDNVLTIWQYGVTEMLNNAIDHSAGHEVRVRLKKTATTTEMILQDDGVGIFTKIQQELGLHDERHAVLELAKGKLTTDPVRHTGEGIFFVSRMFDYFAILSGNVYFSHTLPRPEDWILERDTPGQGTAVFMHLTNNASRTTKQIFAQFSSGDDIGFTKTVVPVRLAQYQEEALISRSQAKRLLARVDRFRTVIFDFAEVEMIGQAFADEVFRVFHNAHPDIDLVSINTNDHVEEIIRRAEQHRSHRETDGKELCNV